MRTILFSPKLYGLPLLVLVLGSLLSWAVFEYEYRYENKQYQAEFEYRAQGHTALIRSGFDAMSKHIGRFRNIMRHQEQQNQSLKLENLKQIKQLFFGSDMAVRDVLWFPSLADDASYNASKTLKLLHVDSPLDQFDDWAAMPRFQSALMRAIEHNEVRSLMLKTNDDVLMLEFIPIARHDGAWSLLLLSWDFSQVVEDSVHDFPVSGQDIHITKVDENVKKLAYFHASRNRKIYKESHDKRHFEWQTTIAWHGSDWLVEYDSAPGFLVRHAVTEAWLLFYGGLIATFLTAFLTLLLYRRGILVQGLVELRTDQLLESEERIRLLMDSVAEGVYDMDLQGRCTFINQTALDLLGYSSDEEVVGKEVHSLFHYSQADGTPLSQESCKIFSVLKKGKAIEVDEDVFWRADGVSIPVSYQAAPVYDANFEMLGLVVTFLDISLRKKAQREREELRDKMEHTQRLESLGVLAGGIAHDFNNLLTSIMGNAALAINAIDEASPAITHMQRIDQASQRAADLCKQMLAYSGQGQFVMKRIQLSELVAGMGQLLEVSMGKMVNVEYHLSDTIADIHADEAQIQQVVMNLITNANEAIGENEIGHIDVKTGMMDVSQDYLDACFTGEAAAPGSHVFIEVKDTGCGMDEQILGKIFEPFFTTKFTGRGLGMSAVLGIVRSHQGALLLHTEVGKGTHICIVFPALAKDENAVSVEQPQVKQEVVHSGVVLVVDDEETLRETAGMMLGAMGFEVLFAEDGEQGIDVFCEHMDEIKMVLLDLTMPRMGGEACLRALRELKPDVRVLVSSGYSEDQYAHLDAAFLSKPYSEKKLAVKINELMASFE